MKDVIKAVEVKSGVPGTRPTRRAAGKSTSGHAAKRERKPAGMTIGIDLGDKVSRYAMLNEDGELVEEGSFRNVVASIEEQFGEGTAPARIALEVGTQSAWIERELRRLGHEVIVANARELAWITASDKKNDRSDAAKLAHLAWADPRLLQAVNHRSAEQQAELNVIRARDGMVRARTAMVNTARSIAKGFGLRLPKSITAVFGVRALSMIPDLLKPALAGLLFQIDQLTKSVKTYDSQVAEMVAQREDLRPVCSIPGVGPLTALTFALTLGSAERFNKSRDVGAFLGMRPKQSQSGNRDPQLAITKAGDKYLRKLAVQCGHHILGPKGRNSALRQWGLKIAASGGKNGKKRAIVAVARKLVVLMHRLWRTGEAFQPFPLTA